MLLDLNGLPLTDLPGILSVISVFSVVKGVCISDAIQYPAKASVALVCCPFGTGRKSASRSDEISDTEKRRVGFSGNADLCGRSERIGTANGNRNSFFASRDDLRDPAIAAATGSGKATGRAVAGTD